MTKAPLLTPARIRSAYTAALAGLAALTSSGWCAGSGNASLWPPVTNITKPWAYWDWMGSAVDETNLSRELHRYADAGLGGMHVIPIYGVKGWEDHYIPYLSPRWMAVLGYAVSEARRHGMDIDMTAGTGWNFGGPNITPELSCLRFIRKTIPLGSGARPPTFENRADVLAVIAERNGGNAIDLTDSINARGETDWVAQGPGWTLNIVTLERGKPEVERGSPGGEGPLLNPFYPQATEHYLLRFDAAFANAKGPKPRVMYNDSYEYHGAAWSPDMYEQFAHRRGYRLEAHRAQLFGTAVDDKVRRVRADYRETLSDLLLESMTQPWVEWSHRRGFLTRNQAHGSPGNLLDLYAAADIPETEMFRTDRDILVSKFASSAAHVAGHPLVSAETGTWVAEHFTETLADLKGNVDDLLLSGANHLFYHATCYSPDEAPWPGWLFYASTEMNPRNSIWRDVPALNAYVQRCQSLLQAGRPDVDVLLYWPIHDLWYQENELVGPLGVHHREWLDGQSLGPLARELWSRGWGFDYVSDRQLSTAKANDGRIAIAGGRYRVVLVPACSQMPVRTMQALLDLARDGAVVAFEGKVPEDVPGLARLEERRQSMRELLESAGLKGVGQPAPHRVKIGRGTVLMGPAEMALEEAGVSRERLTDHGLTFVRRVNGHGPCYYLVNKHRSAFNDWLPLAADGRAAALLDPMTGQAGLAAARVRDGKLQVFVHLRPGESRFLQTFPSVPEHLPHWTYWQVSGTPIELKGNWHVEFIAGGPELPPSFSSKRLGSWTDFGSEAAQRFAGTARYTLTFDAPTVGNEFLLTLGRVAQSARVRLNGRDLGTVFVEPFQVPITEVMTSGNLLEIEVTSVSANRIRDLDRRGVKWKIFHDINFVGVDYKPFDASHWALHEAGLLGPVTIQPATVGWPW